MVLCIIGAVFAALMVLDKGSNPFVAAEAGAQPFGLNPLLLHPAMVLHPPALFIGYVGLAVPFAFAISRAPARPRRQALGAALAEVGRRRLALPLARHRPRRLVGLRGPQLRRLLGLGPRREHVARARGSRPPRCCTPSRSTRRAACSSTGRSASPPPPSSSRSSRPGRRAPASSSRCTPSRSNPLLVWILTSLLVVTVAASSRPDGLALAALREPRRDREPRCRATSSTTSPTCCSRCSPSPSPSPPWRVPLIFDRTVGASTYDLIARPLGVVTLALIAICPLLAWRKTEGAELRKTLILPARHGGAVGAALAGDRASSPTSGASSASWCAASPSAPCCSSSLQRGAAGGRPRQEPLGRPGPRLHRQPHAHGRLSRAPRHGARRRRPHRLQRVQDRDQRAGRDRSRVPTATVDDYTLVVQGHARRHRRRRPRSAASRPSTCSATAPALGTRRAAHRRLPGERRRRARRHPRRLGPGPVRGRRRAVRPDVRDASRCAW